MKNIFLIRSLNRILVSILIIIGLINYFEVEDLTYSFLILLIVLGVFQIIMGFIISPKLKESDIENFKRVTKYKKYVGSYILFFIVSFFIGDFLSIPNFILEMITLIIPVLLIGYLTFILEKS